MYVYAPSLIQDMHVGHTKTELLNYTIPGLAEVRGDSYFVQFNSLSYVKVKEQLHSINELLVEIRNELGDLYEFTDVGQRPTASLKFEVVNQIQVRRMIKIVVPSDSSPELYPDNTIGHYKARLSEPIMQLNQSSTVALNAITYPTSTSSSNFYVTLPGLVRSPVSGSNVRSVVVEQEGTVMVTTS